MRNVRTVAAIGLLVSTVSVSSQDRATPLAFENGRWKLSGDARIETYLGRPSLRVRQGGAEAIGVTFENGTLEFDLAVGTHRNFPMVALRMASEAEYEEFYFRTHKSELPDAIQYVPVWQGVGGWQLYHGPGFTAPVAFPRDQWFHVRIVLSGSKAAVFVGDSPEPQLVVRRLRREPQGGGIGFGAIAPGTPEGTFTTNISNVLVHPGEVPFDFSKVADVEPSPPGVVTEWQISEPFVLASSPIRSLPATPSAHWKTVAAEPSGLVVLDRWVKRAPEDQPSAACARLTVDAADAVTRAFRFGYSDAVTLFLNGQPVFSGDAHYSFDNPRQEGLIGLDQGTVYLPLKKGRNEIVLAVADVFGGWGLMGQFEDRTGLTVGAGR